MKRHNSITTITILAIVSLTSCYQAEKRIRANEDNKVSAPQELKDESLRTHNSTQSLPKPNKVASPSLQNIPSVAGKIKYSAVKEREVYKPGNSVSVDKDFNTEEYNRIYENEFLKAIDHPLSTFSIDVDTASYSNIRRFINEGQTPPPDAVRIEEMVNYFTYNYPQPKSSVPFSINVEMASSPWNSSNKIIKIGLQGKKIPMEKLPDNNLVFLIDTSGSMEDPQKLPLLKESFKLMVKNLRKHDKVSIVTYAGSAGVILPPTSGEEKEKINSSLDNLSSGGSTAGGEGIELAYKLAQENFDNESNNRIILATDGDFNVGISSTSDLVRMIEKKREAGIFLSILGFGMGNYKDSRMEQLADKGNGNYAYIDNINEAKKVMFDQMGSTLFTIAKDVKLQVEFNPAKVSSYRLIGYENRILNKEDFDNDKKDAGELGAGHSVTALYEITPSNNDSKKIMELKYSKNQTKDSAFTNNEIATIKFRYKEPKENKSLLLEKSVKNVERPFSSASSDLKFASAVAGMGMLLRNSSYNGNMSLKEIILITEDSLGEDEGKYRRDFLELVKKYKNLAKLQ